MSAPRQPDRDDPLHRSQEHAEQAAQDAQRRVDEINNAPSDASPPPMPELLRTPVQRPASMQPKQGGVFAGMGELGRSLSIAFDFLFTAAAGALLGFLFDKWRGTLPLATVIGGGLGFLVGTFRLLKRLNAPTPPPSSRPPTSRG